jgi:hypothetical protein
MKKLRENISQYILATLLISAVVSLWYWLYKKNKLKL